MNSHLRMLDGQMSINSKVKIIRKKNGDRISVSPFEAQADPVNLVKGLVGVRTHPGKCDGVVLGFQAGAPPETM
jgi:hypothetical protein